MAENSCTRWCFTKRGLLPNMITKWGLSIAAKRGVGVLFFLFGFCLPSLFSASDEVYQRSVTSIPTIAVREPLTTTAAPTDTFYTRILPDGTRQTYDENSRIIKQETSTTVDWRSPTLT